MTTPEIEVLPLGDHVLLHNRVSGAIVLADPVSVWLLDDPEPDAAEARDLRAQWAEAGLFQDERPDPITQLSLTDQTHTPLVFSGPGGSFVVTLPPGDPLADQLATILRLQLGENANGTPPEDALLCRVEVRAETYSAFEAGRPASGDMSRDDARFHIVRRIAETINGTDQVAVVGHASAVARDGRALILLGTSGRGKTTTALGLLDAGCQHVADDHVPIAADGVSAIGFPGAIALKPGTWDLPEAQRILQGPALPQIRDGSRYVPAPQAVSTGDRLPIAALVFPEYDPAHDPDGPPELTRLSPEEVLITAVQAGARIAPGLRSAKSLATLCNKVPAWHLRYATSQQSVPAAMDLLKP